jgi:hypothetical protein
MVNAARLASLEEVLSEMKGGATAPASRPAPGAAAQAAAVPRASAAAAAIGFVPARHPQSTSTSAPQARTTPTPAVEVRPSAPVTAAPRSIVAAAAGEVSGIEAAQVDAIKAAILMQQKFLGELVEHVTKWELEGGEMRLYFPTESKALAEMLQARAPMEKLRTITSQVVGQPLRVCVRLDATAVGANRATQNSPELKARFEQDPIVRAMLQRFGGKISDVKRRDEE